MKQLIGIEYEKPDEAVVTILENGLRVNIDNRCVFVILDAKVFKVRDSRNQEVKIL